MFINTPPVFYNLKTNNATDHRCLVFIHVQDFFEKANKPDSIANKLDRFVKSGENLASRSIFVEWKCNLVGRLGVAAHDGFFFFFFGYMWPLFNCLFFRFSQASSTTSTFSQRL